MTNIFDLDRGNCLILLQNASAKNWFFGIFHFFTLFSRTIYLRNWLFWAKSRKFRFWSLWELRGAGNTLLNIFWHILHFVAIFGVPRPCVVPHSTPLEALISACGSHFPPHTTLKTCVWLLWHMVNSKPKGYFWGVCVVNLSLKIKNFDQYL